MVRVAAADGTADDTDMGDAPPAAPAGPVQHAEITRDMYGAHWVSPDANAPRVSPLWDIAHHPEIVRKNALVAAAGFDRLEAFDIPVIVETGSLSWYSTGYYTPCLIYTFSQQARALFPSPPESLNDTCYGSGYPEHSTCDKDTADLLPMKSSLKAASHNFRFTVRLQKAAYGHGKTSYNIIGGTLWTLLQTPFWENVRLKHKPWHISL